MKTNLLSKTILEVMVAQVFFAILICTSHAQINGGDPSLKLWLQASTITGADLSGSGVTNWVDSGMFGTIFVPPPLPPADAGDITNRTPQLITVTNNGDVFQAVQFRQAYDALSGGAGHYADRLWQTNNLDASDPTLIDVNSNLTLIFVYLNNNPNSALGPGQCIFAKRGPSACPYEFGLNSSASGIDHMFVTYAGSVVYTSTNSIPPQPEWGIVEMSATAAGVLTFKEYYASHGGWSTSMVPCARGGYSVGVPVTFAFHVQAAGADSGNPWGNGLYERFAGDVAEVALYNRSLSSNELAGIENELLLKYFLQPGPPTFTTQPASQTVMQLDPVTFKVVANGTPPFTYQWLKAGSPISGANGPSYTIPSVELTDATNYSVIVSNGISWATSANAYLTVIHPTNAPTVVSALRDYVDSAIVTVNFSELVRSTSVANASNYEINNGVTVSGASAVDDPVYTNYTKSVVLTTSGVTTAPSVLTLNGITDRFGNTIATNSQVTIPIPGGVAGAPPSANLIMWLAADANVYMSGSQVLEWDDQSSSANNVYASTGSGIATIGQVAFPNAMHPAISFDGTAYLQVLDSSPFNALTNFTIYVVGDVDNTKTSMAWVGDWTGFALGISDGTAGRIKWDTSQADGNNDDIQSGVDLANRVPYLIEGSFINQGQKSIYVNGAMAGNESTNAGIKIAGGAVLTIGALGGGNVQSLVGDIVEVLIYSDVSPSQDTAIQTYLASKYFNPTAVLPTLVSATRNAAQNDSVTVVFSTPVSAATAANASNYTIDQGVTVSAATVVNPTTVTLTTSPIDAGPTYTLTVNGVSDWAGNAIATNSQIAIGGIPAPQLQITLEASSVSITWDAQPPYKLQSAENVNGPWTDVGGGSATSPYVTTPSQASQFYRLNQ